MLDDTFRAITDKANRENKSMTVNNSVRQHQAPEKHNVQGNHYKAQS